MNRLKALEDQLGASELQLERRRVENVQRWLDCAPEDVQGSDEFKALRKTFSSPATAQPKPKPKLAAAAPKLTSAVPKQTARMTTTPSKRTRAESPEESNLPPADKTPNTSKPSLSELEELYRAGATMPKGRPSAAWLSRREEIDAEKAKA